MRLKLIIDEGIHEVNVPEDVVHEAGEVFDKMDRDMDGGWQMGPQWIERPDIEQRCQIVAHRLLAAVETENESLAAMMAGYILARRPDTTAVRVDGAGDMLATELMTSTP